jgi:DNA-binding XRE family transcriptional regulator
MVPYRDMTTHHPLSDDQRQLLNQDLATLADKLAEIICLLKASNGDDEPVGRAEEALRGARSWSQEQLAERASMQRSYLADLERGHRNPSVRTLVKLANAFGMPVLALFEQEEKGGTPRRPMPAP